MGLFSTQWNAEFEGHALSVVRNELGRGFRIEWDGELIASRTWSFLGLGELRGTAVHNGGPVEVRVVLSWEGFSNMDGDCTLTVGETQVPVTQVR